MKRTTLIAAIALMAFLPAGALAQSRTYYGADGKVVGRSTTDSGGATTIYGGSGRVTGRTSTDSSGTTTIYDADGRRIGSVATQPPATTREFRR
jgi:YD repeat-containing protein